MLHQRTMVARAVLVAVGTLLVLQGSPAQAEGIRSTLRYRAASQVKPHDVLIAATFEPVAATTLRPGYVLAHPVAPPKITKVEATSRRVKVTLRIGGRSRTLTYHPTDEVQVLTNDVIGDAVMDRQVASMEPEGSEIKMTLDRSTERYKKNSRVLVLRILGPEEE